MTQHQKIIEMCSDQKWHCQNEFRDLYIFSPHKRRSEIEKKGKYKFISKKCEHGIRGQFDYLMSQQNAYVPILPKISTPNDKNTQPQLFDTKRSFE